MASSRKKSAQKSSKKAAKKTKVVATRARKKNVTSLSSVERSRVLKPRENWSELVSNIVDTWARSKDLHVTALTASKLRTLGARAEKAGQRERKVMLDYERRVRPLSDARLVAEGAVWEAILEVHAAVKYAARKDPELARSFEFLAAALRSDRSTNEAPGGEPAAEAASA